MNNNLKTMLKATVAVAVMFVCVKHAIGLPLFAGTGLPQQMLLAVIIGCAVILAVYGLIYVFDKKIEGVSFWRQLFVVEPAGKIRRAVAVGFTAGIIVRLSGVAVFAALNIATKAIIAALVGAIIGGVCEYVAVSFAKQGK